MGGKEKNSEFQTMFHMMFITVISILGILLISVIALFKWNHWQFWCFMVGAAILACWGAHFFQVGSANARVCFYTFFVFCSMLYYGGKETSITDVPVLICLFIILLSAQQDMKLIYLLACSYLILLLWHIFVTGYIGAGMDELTMSRLVLGVFCLLCAIFISGFFVKQQKREAVLREKLE